jgi:hypothetical protein
MCAQGDNRPPAMYTTHNTATGTVTHNGTKSKRLKVLPQLSAELWREILRLRSMQIEVLREEKLNRHGELGYNVGAAPIRYYLGRATITERTTIEMTRDLQVQAMLL